MICSWRKRAFLYPEWRGTRRNHTARAEGAIASGKLRNGRFDPVPECPETFLYLPGGKAAHLRSEYSRTTTIVVEPRCLVEPTQYNTASLLPASARYYMSLAQDGIPILFRPPKWKTDPGDSDNCQTLIGPTPESCTVGRRMWMFHHIRNGRPSQTS